MTSLSPGSGFPAGGTPVTIAGSGFGAGSEVYFGSAPALSMATLGASRIVAIAPPGSGTVDVTVRTADGSSAAGPVDRFAYAAASTSCAPAFTDVAPDFWAAAPIEMLACAGIVSGLPDGSFHPDQPVTRAEFVKMLDLTMGLKPVSQATPFTDVPASAWFAPYVAAAVAAGTTRGETATTFGPADDLTREAMAVLIARAFRLTAAGTLGFGDAAQIASWAAPSVEAAVAAGYVDGLPDGDFDPLGTATRAQAAKVLAVAAA